MQKVTIKVTALGLLSVASLAGVLASSSAAESRLKINIDPVWHFRLGEPSGQPFAAGYDDSKWDLVSLPHSHELFSANLAGFEEHGRTSGWYRRELQVPAEWLGRKLFLEFQGAMEATTVWVNGRRVGEYAVSGYDSFGFDVSPYVKAGRNVLAVRVDNHVHPELPPDGVEADYILFGGLYRDVFLHVTDTLHVTFPWEARQAGVRLTLPQVSEQAAVVQAEATVRNESARARRCELVTEIRDAEGRAVVRAMSGERELGAGGEATFTQKSEPIVNPRLWSPDDPYLYTVNTIVREGGREVDRVQTRLGLRWVRFDKEKGFFLNGRHVKLIGANYHQTWPFIGGAVPDGLRRRDAQQLKAMGVNWVRLSHYPHAPDLLDALDELGLMALEEPPTWMAPGSGKWMANLETSFRSMIRRDHNHPCIIVWGVCLNHHAADPALVRAALEEDPSRDRGQDTVPIPMNFAVRVVSGNGALAVEHTGHTFPTARGARQMAYRVADAGKGRVESQANREYEQAKRHWEQVNAAYLKPDNAGLAVWCMYDYNTFHNVNEAGMVWHGVCDLFRIPKYSFYWHQSELTSKPMAYVVRIDDTLAAVFSNCERVRLWQDDGKGYKEVATQKPDVSFATREGQPRQGGRGADKEGPFSGSAHIEYGLHHPPFHFTVEANARALKAEGLMGDSVKAVYEWRQFGAPVALTLEADRPVITADGADLSRIIVTAVDTNGTAVDNCDAAVTFAIQGLGQLIGENPVKLRAGRMIILAQAGFVPGELTISAAAEGLRPAKVTVTMQPVPAGVDLPKDLPAHQPTRRALVSSSRSRPRGD